MIYLGIAIAIFVVALVGFGVAHAVDYRDELNRRSV